MEEIPGFILASHCGDKLCEEKIKDETQASTRCIPFEHENDVVGNCIKCGAKGKYKVLFAKAY